MRRPNWWNDEWEHERIFPKSSVLRERWLAPRSALAFHAPASHPIASLGATHHVLEPLALIGRQDLADPTAHLVRSFTRVRFWAWPHRLTFEQGTHARLLFVGQVESPRHLANAPVNLVLALLILPGFERRALLGRQDGNQLALKPLSLRPHLLASGLATVCVVLH